MATVQADILMEIIGWIGALSLLMAYLLISNGKTAGKTYLYQGLNLLGSLGIGINTYYHDALPSVVLNLIWALIGINTIRLIIKNKRENHYE
jgi:hypothetical protein